MTKRGLGLYLACSLVALLAVSRVWARTGQNPPGSQAEITFTLFDPATVLAVTNDIPSIYANRVAAFTIAEVCCEVDDATATTINLQRDDGSPANILTGNLSCATAIGSGCTTTLTAAESTIATGENIDFVLVTNTAAKRINVTIKRN
jgi:hypothetical protein